MDLEYTPTNGHSSSEMSFFKIKTENITKIQWGAGRDLLKHNLKIPLLTSVCQALQQPQPLRKIYSLSKERAK